MEMDSQTPITDALQCGAFDTNSAFELAMTEHARKLETDLAAATREIEAFRRESQTARLERLADGSIITTLRDDRADLIAALAKVEQLIDSYPGTGWHLSLSPMPIDQVQEIRALLAKVRA